jgi:hypothetical protein
MWNIKIVYFFIIVSLGTILAKTRRLQTSSNNLSIIIPEESEPEQIYTMTDKAYYVDDFKYKME